MSDPPDRPRPRPPDRPRAAEWAPVARPGSRQGTCFCQRKKSKHDQISVRLHRQTRLGRNAIFFSKNEEDNGSCSPNISPFCAQLKPPRNSHSFHGGEESQDGSVAPALRVDSSTSPEPPTFPAGGAAPLLSQRSRRHPSLSDKHNPRAGLCNTASAAQRTIRTSVLWPESARVPIP